MQVFRIGFLFLEPKAFWTWRAGTSEAFFCPVLCCVCAKPAFYFAGVSDSMSPASVAPSGLGGFAKSGLRHERAVRGW